MLLLYMVNLQCQACFSCLYYIGLIFEMMKTAIRQLPVRVHCNQAIALSGRQCHYIILTLLTAEPG